MRIPDKTGEWLPGESISAPFFIGCLQLLKALGADNLSDTHNKPQTLVGQVGAGIFQPLELFADLGVINCFFPQ
jgi:hypothetical protein